jgi:hypothetical protein
MAHASMWTFADMHINSKEAEEESTRVRTGAPAHRRVPQVEANTTQQYDEIHNTMQPDEKSRCPAHPGEKAAHPNHREDQLPEKKIKKLVARYRDGQHTKEMTATSQVDRGSYKK